MAIKIRLEILIDTQQTLPRQHFLSLIHFVGIHLDTFFNSDDTISTGSFILPRFASSGTLVAIVFARILLENFA